MMNLTEKELTDISSSVAGGCYYRVYDKYHFSGHFGRRIGENEIYSCVGTTVIYKNSSDSYFVGLIKKVYYGKNVENLWGLLRPPINLIISVGSYEDRFPYTDDIYFYEP